MTSCLTLHLTSAPTYFQIFVRFRYEVALSTGRSSSVGTVTALRAGQPDFDYW